MPSKKDGKSKSSSHGGASAKMKKYPRIADYLQARHPKVYEIIDDLAMHGSLSPRRGGGITFLMPDAALVTKITKLMESDDPEKATDLVSSLILMDYLPTVKEFAAHKDDIPTLLGKKLGVKTVGANKVDIEKGVLTVDTSFVPFSRSGTAARGNMAVWKLDGEVEYEKAPRSEGKYAARDSPRGKKGVEGGRVGGYSGGASPEQLERFIQDVVNAEFRSIRDQASGVKRQSPMLRVVVNQLSTWKRTNSANYDKARAILSLHPIISFFLIYKNRLYFPTSELSVVGQSYPGDAVQVFKDMVGGVSDSGAMFSNRQGVKSAVQALRESTPVNLKAPEVIKAVYANIDATNTISGVAGVYPQSALQAFQTHPGLHLLIDEFRHFLYASIEELNNRQSPGDQARAFNDLVMNVNSFRSLLHPGHTIMDKSDSCDKSKSVTQLQEPFWNNFALHIPCVHFDEDAKYAYTGGADGDDEDAEDKKPEAVHEESLDNLDGKGNDDEEGQELARKLQVWLDAKGDLPEGIVGWEVVKKNKKGKEGHDKEDE